MDIDPPLYFGSISNRGVVCVGGHRYEENLQEVEVYPLKVTGPPGIICAPGTWSCIDLAGTRWESSDDNRAESPLSFAWAPNGAYLATGSGNPERALRVYDVARSEYIDCFGFHRGDLYNVAWSPNGRYIASASTYSKHELKLWECRWLSDELRLPECSEQIPLPLFSESPAFRTADRLQVVMPRAEVNRSHDHLPWWLNEWLSNVREFYGFGKLSFSPDSRSLAVEHVFRTHKTRIAVYTLPELEGSYFYQLPDGVQVSDITWNADGDSLWVSTYEGKLFHIGSLAGNGRSGVVELQIRAERCAVNPNGRLCAISFRHDEDEKGRDQIGVVEPTHTIRILTMPQLRVIAELRGCSEVRELVWSPDGTELFALTCGSERLHCHLNGGR